MSRPVSGTLVTPRTAEEGARRDEVAISNLPAAVFAEAGYVLVAALTFAAAVSVALRFLHVAPPSMGLH